MICVCFIARLQNAIAALGPRMQPKSIYRVAKSKAANKEEPGPLKDLVRDLTKHHAVGKYMRRVRNGKSRAQCQHY